MRITSGMYYKNIDTSNTQLNKELFDVNRQIASGRTIQYAHEDSETFSKTLRLDDEVATLTQVKKSSQAAYKFSTQSDTTIGEMETILRSFRTTLLAAANETNAAESYYAFAAELEGMKTNLMSLANTSIDGKYLFSGTNTGIKPIDAAGNYRGNDGDMNAFFGNDVQQKYNITGQDLFFGEEGSIQKEVSTNIKLIHATTSQSITASDTILDLMDGNSGVQNFYIRGTQSDGTSFKEVITLNDTDTVDDLLNGISNAYGNRVDVTMANGYIVITDKVSGSSKLDFHIVGNTGATATDIDTLGGTVKAFNKSALIPAAAATGVEAAIYDRNMFTQEGATVTSNVAQIVSSDNSIAVDETALAGVFSNLSSTLHIGGNRIDGSAFNIDISLGSPATVSGDYNYNIANGAGVDTDGADMTYRQLLDVINMAMNNNVPSDNNAGYRAAIEASNVNSSVNLTPDGRIEFVDKNNIVTQANLTIYDNNSNDFTNTNGAMATFNTNNALSIRDPKTDFFGVIDAAIFAVKEARGYPDGNADNPRNNGISNALSMLDDLLDHTVRMQTQSGAHSNTLSNAQERTEMLLISTQTLRSEVIDTDIAEAYLRLEQLKLNQQATLSTVSKISQLSLVNYL